MISRRLATLNLELAQALKLVCGAQPDCMLPYPALTVLIEHINDTRMGVFVNLAQINRASRRFFLSDCAWKRFDVHQVHGQRNIYTYGDYQLEGIAAHYYNWLCSLHPPHRRWHMPFSEPSYIHTVELYDQLNYLARLSEGWSRPYTSPPISTDIIVEHLLGSDKQVWRCWKMHPLPETRDWKIDPAWLSPLFKDKALYTKIACCVRLYYSYRSLVSTQRNPYQDDRDLNLLLVQRGQWDIVPDHYKEDENFMLEALSKSRFSACFPLHKTATLLDRLYDLNYDKAVDFATLFNMLWPRFSERMRYDERFVSECVSYNTECLDLAGKMRDNVAVMSAAIRTNPKALEQAQKLRNNKEIVKLAISMDPQTLKWASRRLRDNTKLVRSCTDRDPEVIKYASFRVRQFLKLDKWLKKRCLKSKSQRLGEGA